MANGASQGYGGWVGIDPPSGRDGPTAHGFNRRSVLGPEYDRERFIARHGPANVRREFETAAQQHRLEKYYSGHTTDNPKPVVGAQHYWIQYYKPSPEVWSVERSLVLEVSSMTRFEADAFATHVIAKLQVMHVAADLPAFVKFRSHVERMLAEFAVRLERLPTATMPPTTPQPEPRRWRLPGESV